MENSNSMNEEAPAPKKKKELKTFSFTKEIQHKEETPQGPQESKDKKGNKEDNKENKEDKSDNNVKPEKKKESIILNFTIILYEEEIYINVKQNKKKIKAPHIIYEKSLFADYFKNSNNKFLAILTLDKIFDFMEKSLGQNLYQISFGESELVVKVIINLMDVMTEEINIEIPMIKMSTQEEMTSLKESMKFLDEERTELRNEIKTLNDTLEELRKKIKEKDAQQGNVIQELKNMIENNKIEFEKKIQENKNELEKNKSEVQKQIEDNKTEFQKQIEDNKKEFEENKTEVQRKFEENKIELDKNKTEVQRKLDEKDNEVQKKFEERDKEISDLRKTEVYVKDKLICEEKDIEEEEEKHVYKRELELKNTKEIYNLEISMLLFKEKIKFTIKEIQDKLKNNPSVYEANFDYENLSQKTVHFKSLGNLENIFNFLHELFNASKDSIKKEKEQIIINVKFPLGNKETEISLVIVEKGVSLQSTLKCFSETLKEINKNYIVSNVDLKNTTADLERTKNDLDNTKIKLSFEKIYPIGSIYLSINGTNPSDLFGIGEWELLKDRFLIGAGNKYYVGDKGGNTSHKLTIEEMPSHTHVQNPHNHYTNIYWNSYYPGNLSSKGYLITTTDTTKKDGPGNYLGDMSLTTATNQYTGGNQSFDIINPYLSVYMWKRIR